MAEEVNTPPTDGIIRIDEAPGLVERIVGHKFNLATFRRWAKEDKFKTFKLGGIRFVDVTSLRLYLDSMKKGTTP